MLDNGFDNSASAAGCTMSSNAGNGSMSNILTNAEKNRTAASLQCGTAIPHILLKNQYKINITWYRIITMAISVQRHGASSYIIYGYAVGKRNVRIYCGKKGEPGTEIKLKEAKQKHLDDKIKHMTKKLMG